ncbi:hypothetical protein KR018_008949 [Drosophila ironensis]|nr:hypothetical protein KR018_008949 [Drosophila ironensis]
MSFVRLSQYYVRISSRDRKRKVMKVFDSPLYISEVLCAAKEFGIDGKYLMSGEDNAIIGDADILAYFIRRGHTIVVAESLDSVDHISLGEIGESHTDDDNGSENSLPDAKQDLCIQLRRFSAQFVNVMAAFSNFVKTIANLEEQKKAPFQAGLLNTEN